MSIRTSIAALILALFLMLMALANPLPETYLQRDLFEGSLWRVYLDLNSNAFFVFRKESVLASIEAFTAGLIGPRDNIYLILCYLSFFFGSLLFFFLYASGRNDTSALLAAAFLSVTIYFIFGNDIVIASSLAWFPWLVLLITSALSQLSPTPLHYLLILFFALRVAKGANQLSLLVVIFAIGLALLITANRDSSQRNIPAIVLSIVLALAPALFVALKAPETPYPEYHSFSRVHAFDGTVGMARPHIGPTPPIAVIDREYIRGSYSWLGELLFILLIAVGFAGRKKLTPAGRNLLWLSLALCVALIVDSSLAARFSEIGPLATLGRILPHLYYFPLTPVAAALATFLLFYFSAGLRTLWMPALLSVFLLVWGAVATSSGLRPGIVDNRSHIAFGESVRAALDEDNGELERQLISPSFPIYRLHGLFVFTINDWLSDLTKVRARPFVEEVYASRRGQRRLRRMLDQAAENRWTAGQGRQTGEEWIFLQFKGELKLVGVQLETGAYRSDFPRGLSVYYDRNCEFDERNPYAAEKEFVNVFRDPDWKGSIRFTSDGHPYYGGQHHVEIYFPQEVTARCLFIRQTGKTPHFDWSVTGINLFLLDHT